MNLKLLFLRILGKHIQKIQEAGLLMTVCVGLL